METCVTVKPVAQPGFLFLETKMVSEKQKFLTLKKYPCVHNVLRISVCQERVTELHRPPPSPQKKDF